MNSFRLTRSFSGAFHLGGELDMAAAPQFRAALGESVSAGGPITVDISDLNFMDSTGLNEISLAAKGLGDRGCVIIHGLDGNAGVRKVIEITRVGSVRNIHVIPCEVIVGRTPS